MKWVMMIKIKKLKRALFSLGTSLGQFLDMAYTWEQKSAKLDRVRQV